jgi:dipeptidyl-peptidase III
MAMRTIYSFLLLTTVVAMINSCGSKEKKVEKFDYFSEQFADLKILRYQIPDFEDLTIKQKTLAYYLAQAALVGREITIDQNYRHNLKIKRTLEAIYKGYKGDRKSKEFENFIEYLKRFSFSNGIHHHYSTRKFYPTFSKNYFADLVRNCPHSELPLAAYGSVDYLIAEISLSIFGQDIDLKRVNQNPDEDMVETSAVNFYQDITQKEAEAYYAALRKVNDPTPISYGLNSKLMRDEDGITERKWKVGGMYSPAIEAIVYWLSKAIPIAENPQQAKAIGKLIDFYQSGDLNLFDEYCVLWVQDTTSVVDFVNGFIETYGDPLGMKGTYESFVTIKDFETSKKFGVLAEDAKWFETYMPVQEEFKKKNPQGISYKVVNVVALAGDMSPYTAIGVNLPNADWIRARYGSKSVSLANIENAYNEVSKTDGTVEEFFLPYQAELIKKHGSLGGKLHTGLHEVIGHGSGQLKVGVKTPDETLKNYASTIEEARADLVALYYLLDEHLLDLKLIETLDVGKAEYISYIHNGLLGQLKRIKMGEEVEEAHMRNRQLIAKWAFELGKDGEVIKYVKNEGKTYIEINDYDKLRQIFGKQLREIQRIKSEGDYDAARSLVEKYAVKVDVAQHREIIDRFTKLNIAPYSGFINPVLVPVFDGDEIIDVLIEYPNDFLEQMLFYSKEYSLLPLDN